MVREEGESPENDFMLLLHIARKNEEGRDSPCRREGRGRRGGKTRNPSSAPPPPVKHRAPFYQASRRGGGGSREGGGVE